LLQSLNVFKALLLAAFASQKASVIGRPHTYYLACQAALLKLDKKAGIKKPGSCACRVPTSFVPGKRTRMTRIRRIFFRPKDAKAIRVYSIGSPHKGFSRIFSTSQQ